MRNVIRWVAVLLTMFAALALALASSAKAVGIPGTDICPKTAPFAQTPETGLAGMLGERPKQITTDNNPEHIWSTGGFAGMRSHTYDLGCAIDPTSWGRITSTNTESGIANAFLTVGDAVVSLTDSIDRRAWQPGWIVSFLNDFVNGATGTIINEVLLPWLTVAITLAAALLLWRSHKGDYSAAATNVGWVFVVMVITSFLLISPLLAAQSAQKGGGAVVAMMNGGSNASDAATNKIVQNVEYQGFLRRNFGTAENPLAKEYGPRLLASTRVSWAEMDAIEKLPADKQSKARDELADTKEKDFKDIASKIKDADKTTYRYIQGAEPQAWETIVELAFIVCSSGFRLAAAVLMVTCAVVLGLLAMLWLMATPAIVLPKIGSHTGQQMGLGMINSGVMAVKYVLMAALGSWLFSVYAQAAMKPGLGLGWSLLMLLIGTGIAWTLIRPDRKFLEIVSLGRVDGYGYTGTLLKGFLASYLGARMGSKAGVESAEKDQDEPVQEPERLSENVIQQPEVVQATIYNPTPPFRAEQPTTVDAEPVMGSVVPSLPSGQPVYERGDSVPPPDAAQSPYTPYERSDDNEGADL